MVDSNGKHIELVDEPDNIQFENSIYNGWKEWDSSYGKYDEDRSDYEPWAYDSKKALANELNLIVVDVKVYYKRSFD